MSLTCKRTAGLGRVRLRFVGALVCLVVAVPHVSTGSARGPASQGSTSGVAAGGAIAGTVLYRGEPPPPVFVPESGGASPVLRVDRDSGGLQYAVVYVDASGPARAGRVSDAARHPHATVVQRGFIFDPPIVAILAGQRVRFTNEDSANHNVRSADRMPANRFNAYTGAGQEYVHRFAKPPAGGPVVLTCDIHEWMAGWVYVFDHPWFAVTDRQGRFRIEGVPAGSYALAIRQTAGGLARDLRVDVTNGATADVEVAFGTADLRKPVRQP